MGFCSKAITANVNSCSGNLGGITAITLTPIDTTKSAGTMEIIPETAHLESTYAFNASTGVGIWTTNLFIKIGELSATNGTSVNSIAGNNITATITFGNGSSMTIGSATIPAYATAGNVSSGTAYGDDHGIDITVTAKSADVPAITTPTE